LPTDQGSTIQSTGFGARASTEDTSAPRKQSVPEPSVATSTVLSASPGEACMHDLKTMNLNRYTLPSTGFVASNVSLLGTSDIQLNPILTCNPTSGLGHNQFINPSCFSFPTQIGQNTATELPAIYGPAFFNWDLGLFKNI